MSLLGYEEFDKNPFVFRIWNGGMINQLMSIEFATATSAFFSRHGILIESCKISSQANYVGDKHNLSIFELVEIPNFLSSHDGKFDFSNFDKIEQPSQFYIGEYDKSFGENRHLLELEASKNFYFDNTLCNYSIMFSHRTPSIDLALSNVRFKQEYVEFANYICLQLGKFNGIHLRFTDFSTQILRLKKEHITDSIQNLSDSKILISTDDYAAFSANKVETINVASLIINDYFKDFASLSIANELTLGLVSLLVMCSSQRFIGTPMSTYSNYIHRTINQRNNGVHDWQSIGRINKKCSGQYSWNAYQEIPMDQKVWGYEWPESLLMLG